VPKITQYRFINGSAGKAATLCKDCTSNPFPKMLRGRYLCSYCTTSLACTTYM